MSFGRFVLRGRDHSVMHKPMLGVHGKLREASGNTCCITAQAALSPSLSVTIGATHPRHLGQLRHLQKSATRRVVDSFAGKIVLYFLPAYCPDDNRIERVWLDLHANVTRNHRCANIHTLMLKVASFLCAYNHRHRLSPSLRQTRARRAA